MVAGVPLFSFGIIADVQHADKPDSNGYENRPQHYKSSATKLSKAVEHFNTIAGELSFVLSLGDIVDGNATKEKTLEDLERVASVFDRLTLDTKHVIGNHCLSVPREVLLKRLGVPASSYFAADVAPGWRLLVLDTTEMSPHSGYPEDSWQAKETAEFQAAHPQDQHPNMAPWNGGATNKQLDWLRQELAAADCSGKRCLVACHHPIGKGCGRETHMAWNAPAIEAALNASPSVAAVFSGHDHIGGYSCNAGKHYVIPEAMLESPEDSTAYGIVAVFDDRLDIQGFGTVTSRSCPFKKRPAAE